MMGMMEPIFVKIPMEYTYV